jgi:hypothetical protein
MIESGKQSFETGAKAFARYLSITNLNEWRFSKPQRGCLFIARHATHSLPLFSAARDRSLIGNHMRRIARRRKTKG